MHGITNYTGLGREAASEFLTGKTVLNVGQILILPPNNTVEPEVYIGIGKVLSQTPGLRGDTLLRLQTLEDEFDGHTHPISEIIGLQLALDGKAALIHTHGMGDITGLVAALEAKASIAYVDAADALRPLTTDVNDALALKANDNAVLKIAQNLNDLANKSTARTNLGVYSKAETDALITGDVMLKSANLSGLANYATARDNMGLAYDTAANQRLHMQNIGVVLGGQCELVKDGSDVRLNRFNGKFVMINGRPEEIPTAGVAIAPTGLTAGNNYYVYVWMDAGVMTLEVDATAPSTFATVSGIRCKGADTTRTLVGFVRINTGPAFTDTAALRYVRSWFNRRPIHLKSSAITANTAAASFNVMDAGHDIAVLAWAGESLRAELGGACYLSLVNATNGYLGVGLSGVAPTLGEYAMVQSNGYSPLFAANQYVVAADGLVVSRIWGAVDNTAYTVTAYRAIQRGILTP